MRKLLALLLVVAMMFSVAACGSGNNKAPATEPTSGDAAGEKTYKDHITVGIHAQLTTLDPTQKNNLIQNVLYNLTHDTLIYYNNDTKEYEPSLALTWKWVDDVTLELTLREGVVFHDGTTFDAYDVEATLARANNGLITGYYDHCEIIDDYTIRTIIKEPNVDWVFTLAHNVSAICSAEAIAENPDKAYVGTGPWKVTNFVSGDSVDLERNENYWGQVPNTKKLTLRYYGESSARLIALENGEIDFMTNVSPTELAYAKNNKNIVVEEFLSSNIYYFCFNCSKEPGNDINLRRAVACAINREEIVAAMGGGKVANTFWGINSLGWTEDFDLDLSYNPEKAKEYAAKAKSTEFTLITSDAYSTLAQVLQEQLRRVGITMNIQEMDSAGISAATAWGADHEAVIYSIATNASGSDMFRLIAYGTAGNRACILDEKDPLYTLQKNSVSTFDEAERIKILEELQTYMHDNAIYIGLIYGNGNVAYAKGIENPGVLVNMNHDLSQIQLPIN